MRLKPTLVIALTVALAVMVMLHTPGLNGPWYWNWSWRRLGFWPLYPLMLAAAAPFVAAQWAYGRGRLKLAVLLLAATTLCLQLAALASQPPTGLRRLPVLVMSTGITSYWTDAKILLAQTDISLGEMLAQFPDIVPLLHMHAKYKPPGLILYYMFWIKLLGPGDVGAWASAWAGGLGIALLASAAAPACFAMLRLFSRNPAAAFCGASYLALCPSLVLFFPQFDQVYVTLLCVILFAWGKAAHELRWRWAVICGAVLALALFCSYILLVLGCFIVVDWLFLLSDRGVRHFRRAALRGIAALGTVGLIYLVLHAASGFDPIATFWSISAVQMKELIPLTRPFPQHVLHDILDFALACGWIGFLLTAFFLLAAKGRLFSREPGHRMALIALIQIGTVAFAALLPGETARLWMLLLPLLMAPIGLELSNWPTRSRRVTYACLWLMLVVICQNMTFSYAGPELDGTRW